MRKNHLIKSMTLSAMFLALALALPFLTWQIPLFGNMLLPMHLPVLLCGAICGWKYGMVVGLIAPVMRYFLFGMPPMPTALTMAFELAAYGALIGLLYCSASKRSVKRLYLAMGVSLLVGRVVLGVSEAVVYTATGEGFGLQAFLVGSVLKAIPGILLQLILVPAILVALDRSHLVPFSEKEGPNDTGHTEDNA